MRGEGEALEKFCNAIKSLIEQKLKNVKYLLDSCNVFELGNNANADEMCFEEPDANSVNSMVSDFLDLAFEQAQILSFLKQIMLRPLTEHISKCTRGFRKAGNFTLLSQNLRGLINNFYLFGWV